MTAVSDEVSFGPEVEHTARMKATSMDVPFGRPLSTIESIASSAEDEEDEERLADARREVDVLGHNSRPNLRTQVDELMRLSNNLDEERKGESSSNSTSPQGRERGSIRLKDLPRLLAEYEKEKGRALLNDEARPVLDGYVQASPDTVLQADSLQQMIAMLNDSQGDAHQVEAQTQDLSDETVMQVVDDDQSEIDLERRQASTTSESETDASSLDGDHSSLDQYVSPAALVQPADPVKPAIRAAFQFPRSQSERKITEDVADNESRSHDDYLTPMKGRTQRTTSDPTAPPPATHNRRVSASAVSQPRTEGKREKKSSDGVDKEILRGKGKAKIPPSSWSNARPRPPALVKRERHRRISDLSSTRSDDIDQENVEAEFKMDSPDHQQSMLGMGTPSRPPRHRLSSQPEVLRESNGLRLPRSASSASTGFVFPRTQSFQHSDELEDHLSEDGDPSPLAPSFPRQTSSRAASPVLDEQSYHNFSALSPTVNNEYPSSPPLEGRSSRRSSGAGRRRTLVGDEADASFKSIGDSIAIRARLEAVSRQLTEKERQHDAVQQEHEIFISRLQDELDESRALIGTKRREEKESKARENSHLDSIASLEADLNKTEKALETTREQLAKSRADYDEQVLETGRLRGKLSEVMEDVERLKTEERMHADNAKSWEYDRETYREKISLLHAQIDKIEDEAVKLQDSERENKVLKEQLERLTIEMDELRRGSSLMGSIRSKGSEINGTISKRLSSELARQLASANDDEDGDSDDTEEGLKTGDGDESVEHIYLVERRKAKKNRGRTETQQTNSEPPTYDEAAHEKQVSDRLHPPSSTLAKSLFSNGTYRDLVRQTGKRCTTMESLLQESTSSESNTRLLLFKKYCSDFMLQVISILPLSKPRKSNLKILISEKHDARGIIAFFLLHAMICFALAPLLATIFTRSSKSIARDLLNEDWGISNALELSWGSTGPLPTQRTGFLDWIIPSHRYDPTIRMPT